MECGARSRNALHLRSLGESRSAIIAHQYTTAPRGSSQADRIARLVHRLQQVARCGFADSSGHLSNECCTFAAECGRAQHRREFKGKIWFEPRAELGFASGYFRMRYAMISRCVGDTRRRVERAMDNSQTAITMDLAGIRHSQYDVRQRWVAT